MTSNKTKKAMKSIEALKSIEERKVLNKLEAGLKTQISGKDINKLYNEKLAQNMDLKETVNKSLAKVKKEPKKKVVKPITERGEKCKKVLSKYREEVKVAMQLKKNIDDKNLLSYSDEEDDEIEDIEPQIPPPIIPKPEPKTDLSKIYGEIEDLKKKNQYLEDRYLIRNTIQDISTMRRNMSIKF